MKQDWLGAKDRLRERHQDWIVRTLLNNHCKILYDAVSTGVVKIALGELAGRK